MARTTINPQVPLGSYPVLPISSGGADLSFTAASGGVISYQAALTNAKTQVLAHNSDTVNHTVTITSVADTLNRTGNIVYVVAPGAISLLGPFQTAGWSQVGTLLFIDIDSDLLQIAVVNEI